MRIILYTILFAGIKICVGQVSTAALRGKVLDAISRSPVSGASVIVAGKADYSTITDSFGCYTIAVSPGRYCMHVDHTSFKTVTRDNIVVRQGKQEVQDFELNEFALPLDTVSVTATTNPSVFDLNSWNTQQFAAAFYDPARVVNTHAGVVNVDDQSNNVSVRGTSPNFVQWNMEGVEIVNPNHLENAGMINDRPSFNGGGVSMISNQLLERSSFSFAPFDAMQGNALSGIFDIRLRKGNDSLNERIVQASLLGTDVCLEGPLSKKRGSSYIFNARYSTIGLLSLMGVNFGDEQISFLDVSWQLAFPTKKGMFKLFGVAGTSSNVFKGETDTSLVEIEKELRDIRYTSKTAIGGFSFVTSITNTVYFKAVGAYSVKETERISDPVAAYPGIVREEDMFDNRKLSAVLFIAKRFGTTLRMKFGTYATGCGVNLHSALDTVVLLSKSLRDIGFRPFAAADWNLSNRFTIHAGLHGLHSALSASFDVQPRVQATYKIADNHSITLHAGTTAQTQSPYLLAADEKNMNLKPTLSQNISLIHQIKIRSYLLKTEMYYAKYTRLPVNDAGFSAFNYFNGPVNLFLTSGGNAQVYGAEFTVQRNVREFYCMFSGGMYESVYEVNRIVRDARFNANYNVVLTTGNEFSLKDKRKSIGVHLRGFTRDGFRDNDLNLDNSFIYPLSLPVYYRIDFRVSFKKEKVKSSYVWALDIQNLTNAQNIVYHYYDNVTKRIEEKPQLGLIPVLSYRIFF